jgi:hypothetical protein
MIQQNHYNNITVIPTLEEYLELGRELNGFSMILDLSEILEITHFPELQGEHAEKLLELKNTAFDVIAWSMVFFFFLPFFFFFYQSDEYFKRMSLLINLI